MSKCGYIDCFAEPAADEHAIAGPDGQRATALLANAQRDGSEVFAQACESAVRRLMASGDPLGQGVLFDDTELADIADALSRCIATADLMGRTRVRRRAELVAARSEGFAEGGGDDPFHDFADPVPSLSPDSAVAYFQGLTPTLAPAQVRYGERLDRHAFTLAVASDQVLLDRVKAAILKALREGGDATPDVQDILDAAGVSPKNPQYAELVVRTNVMDAYNQGAAAELQEPEMQDSFPAWEYLAVLDDRIGDDHRPRAGKYYPSSVSFAEVRGPRVWNCRCSFSPVHKSLMGGVRVETSW